MAAEEIDEIQVWYQKGNSPKTISLQRTWIFIFVKKTNSVVVFFCIFDCKVSMSNQKEDVHKKLR